MDEKRARELLDQERSRLQGIVRDREDSASQPVGTASGELNPRSADTATDTFDREIDQSLVGHAEAELEEVEAALQRLEDGTYGRCQECGQTITDERLEARPVARYDVEHQHLAEHRAGIPDDRAGSDPTH